MLFRKITLLCLAATFFLASWSVAERDRTVIAFGDSVTVGLWENDIINGNGGKTGGYGPDLEAMTVEQKKQYDVLNYGWAGEKTLDHDGDKGGRRRIMEDVLPRHPNAEFALIMEGTNDYWANFSRQSTAWALGEMVDACRSYGVTPIVATLTPDMTKYAEGKNIPAYNVLIKQMATDKGVKIVDMYSAMVDEWMWKYAYGRDYVGAGYNDYLHLSRTGYVKMAELWFQAFFQPNVPTTSSWLPLLLKD